MAAIASRQQWNVSQLNREKSQFVFVVAALHGLVIAFKYSITNPLAILVLCFSLGLLFISLASLRQRKYVAAALAHSGLALLCLGVILSSLAAEKMTASLQPGEAIRAFGQEIRYEGSLAAAGLPEKRQLFSLANASSPIAALTKYTADGREAAHEPAIYRMLTGDFYLAPGQQEKPPLQQLRLALDKPQESAGLRYTLKGVQMDSSDPDALKFIARILVQSAAGQNEYALAMVHNRGSFQSSPVMTAEHYELSLQALNKDKQEISLAVADLTQAASQKLALEISFKPMIGLVWLGCTLLTLGCFTACAKRALAVRRQRKK